MRKTLSIALIIMLVLPAFAPWMPHGAVHALYDSHVSVHHGSDHGRHQHHHHTDAHLLIHLDLVNYFNDYLHVDLKKPEYADFDLPQPDLQGFDQPLNSVIYPQRYELAVIASRAPPDYLRPRPDNTPLYLSTQRLRI